MNRAATLAALPILLAAAAWGLLGSLPAPLSPLAWLAALWLPGAALCARPWMPLALGPVVFGAGLCLGRGVGLSLNAAALSVIVLSAVALLVRTLRDRPAARELERPRALPLAAGAAVFLLGALPSLVHEPLRLRDDARLHVPVIQRVLHGDFPPENPFLAGEPLAYFWFYHVTLAGASRVCPGVSLDLIPALFNAQALLVLLLAVNRLGARLGLPPPARAASLAFLGLGFSPQGWVHLLHLLFTRPELTWTVVDASGAAGLFPVLSPPDPRLAAVLTKVAISNAFPMSLALAALALAPPFRARSRTAWLRHGILVAGCLLFHLATGILLAAGLGVRWILARATLREPSPLKEGAVLLALVGGTAVVLPYLIGVLQARSGGGAAVLGLQIGHALRLHLALAGVWLCSLPALLLWTRRPVERAVLAAGLPALALPFAARLVDGNEYKSLFFLLLLLAPAAGLGLTRALRRIPMAAPVILALFVPTPFLAARAYVRDRPPGTLADQQAARLTEIGRGLPGDAVLWKAGPGKGYSSLTVPLARSFYLSDPYALRITGQWDGPEARWRRDSLGGARPLTAALQAARKRVPDRPFVALLNYKSMRSDRSLHAQLESLGTPVGEEPQMGLRFYLLPGATPRVAPEPVNNNLTNGYCDRLHTVATCPRFAYTIPPVPPTRGVVHGRSPFPSVENRMPKRLVIVESPAKARTLSRFLGQGYVVDSSIGHIRDLPSSAAQIPAKYKKEAWARLGVDVENGFVPLYVVPADKKKKVTELKSQLKGCDELLLATDEDREGEAISWHLVELLKPKVPYSRLVFHEITKDAVRGALEETRPIDEQLVAAQETRRILDRLYGYEISPLLWKKIGPGLSAGRVQSVAIKILVDRERARMRFRESVYWDLEGTFETGARKSFPARLISLDGRRVATGRDFDPETGDFTNREEGVWVDAERARTLVEELTNAPWRVIETETKSFTQHPAAPFTTSTLQQEGSRKLRFSARRTMQVAQRLYENGYITYMRTDSPTLSEQAVKAARSAVTTLYDDSYLSPQPRQFKAKVKNAQEAHEAIRPAGESFRTPAELKGELDGDGIRLYELIWKRTVASQMAEARGRRMTVRLQAKDAVFQATGKVIDFPGFLRVYVEGSDDPEADLAEKDTILPDMSEGDPLSCTELEPKEHRTLPPARFTEASLVKELEADGIGRPSTYASIISTIERREYTFRKGSALVPTFLAFAVVNLLERHFPELVDTTFTARMEDDLDAISRGESESIPYLETFYFGNGQQGLRPQIDLKSEKIDPRRVCSIPIGEDGGEPVIVRVGRYGPFLQRGEDTAPVPDGSAPDELTLEKALELLALPQGPQKLGEDPETGEAVYVREGRFGPYVQLGEMDDAGNKKKKPKTQSLLKGMSSESVDLETALKLLHLPRVVGQDENGEDVTANYGRYGAYLKRGSDTRSLERDDQVFTVTLPEAIEILKQPKKGRRRRSEPLRVLGESKDLGAEIKVMQGPYGIYVTDGKTNAGIPKGESHENVTLQQAEDLIKERLARGGGRKKKTAKKKTARKKAPKKKAPKKKAAKKKSSKKSSSSDG